MPKYFYLYLILHSTKIQQDQELLFSSICSTLFPIINVLSERKRIISHKINQFSHYYLLCILPVQYNLFRKITRLILRHIGMNSLPASYCSLKFGIVIAHKNKILVITKITFFSKYVK